MFKNLITPIQVWLLSQGRCVGCGEELSKGKKAKNSVSCRCGRAFVKDQKTHQYRRALFEDLE